MIKGPGVVRVLQMNIFHRTADWGRRRVLLRNGLREYAPDLVALAETVVTADYDQVRDLLGPGWFVHHQRERSADGAGISLASRWPLVDVQEVDLSVTDRAAEFPGVSIIARLHAPDPIGGLIFVNHKPTWQCGYEYERELQAVKAARAVEALVGREFGHVVLAGDFDAVPEAASVRFWTGRQSLERTSVMYRDAWEAVNGVAGGHTFTPVNPLVRLGEMPLEIGRRIDYVLVRATRHGPTLRVADCRQAFAEPDGEVWASDHFGVLADLEAHPYRDGSRSAPMVK
ncbi:endonuclease/exonuclease/phosphatase family protein [Actinoplanes sp. KI2]|uniref:endonuclease/exonuclease/phosphatase family protein n=1 Tax=Actinoplanes sp. KI2 TaxID=2983315 RepID=UPI0021D5DA53|nr:endonuclease/exonuclease/phosphatase family protein [Actinoplanes sp. KI2]MCU7727562.1 endonuclease/exonuclease/phosphatase family protein [Actinoplanes sp. KI2]